MRQRRLVAVLHGRGAVGGKAAGRALVARKPLSGGMGINPKTGEIVEIRHDLRGQSFAGKVLVFPGAKGSSGWSINFHMARLFRAAPVGMVVVKLNTKAALGAVVARCPTITDLDLNPLDWIMTGDWVELDGDSGTVTVYREDGPEHQDPSTS